VERWNKSARCIGEMEMETRFRSEEGKMKAASALGVIGGRSRGQWRAEHGVERVVGGARASHVWLAAVACVGAGDR
jgi:hypothetical protein